MGTSETFTSYRAGPPNCSMIAKADSLHVLLSLYTGLQRKFQDSFSFFFQKSIIQKNCIKNQSVLEF
jgi:hypothetical protein